MTTSPEGLRANDYLIELRGRDQKRRISFTGRGAEKSKVEKNAQHNENNAVSNSAL